MKNDSNPEIHRQDYQPPSYVVDTLALVFDLDPQATRVHSSLRLRRNPAAASGQELKLNGHEMSLVDLRVDGQVLPATAYTIDDESLTLLAPPAQFELETVVSIDPSANTTLNGLYLSNGNFFTQCEAEGFRRICYYPDRPDVMARFRVTLRAPKDSQPILLSNGNLLESGDWSERAGWHYAVWDDPFPKPSYLFALVAGTLVCSEQRINPGQVDEKLLQVWVEPGNEDKTDHAMQSLVRAIEWDQRRYGLPLDLDRFMIVAVSDFNMGAMENKGLNIFNTKYVFANPEIATDTDFNNVESVVGHEYFHNWTGNRVTCRDWFQLTLKEGLTVFRDQQFSADMQAESAQSEAAAASARAVKRIEDVRLLRVAQFAEDAGPMAHPIRPDSYTEINNFYTVTVYEKGAEVIRMLHTLVGEKGFRKGIDLYFERHDGQAVTCDDFLAAIADANQRDFSQFANWYSQAGTPVLQVSGRYLAEQQRYELTIAQSSPVNADGDTGQPFHIPIRLALLDGRGQELPLRLAGQPVADSPSAVFELTRTEQVFVFDDIAEPPVPSLLRGFSAPVKLNYPYTDRELGFLAAHDSDPFNRWEAGQRLALSAVLAVLGGADVAASATLLVSALRKTLTDSALDPAYRALVGLLPAEGYIAEHLAPVDPIGLRDARNAVRRQLATELHSEFTHLYSTGKSVGPYRADNAEAGRRALANLALSYAVLGNDDAAFQMAAEQLKSADNMTDRAAALSALVNSPAPQRESSLNWFADRFQNEALVIDKWYSMQATMHRQADDPPVLQRVKALAEREDFSIRNPNRVRSLVSAFCTGNLAEFHAADGSGYRFWLEQVRELDAINPQLAARLARAMDRWKKFDPQRQQHIRECLTELAETTTLSRDVAEIVTKALAH